MLARILVLPNTWLPTVLTRSGYAFGLKNMLSASDKQLLDWFKQAQLVEHFVEL